MQRSRRDNRSLVSYGSSATGEAGAPADGGHTCTAAGTSSRAGRRLPWRLWWPPKSVLEAMLGILDALETARDVSGGRQILEKRGRCTQVDAHGRGGTLRRLQKPYQTALGILARGGGLFFDRDGVGGPMRSGRGAAAHAPNVEAQCVLYCFLTGMAGGVLSLFLVGSRSPGGGGVYQ